MRAHTPLRDYALTLLTALQLSAGMLFLAAVFIHAAFLCSVGLFLSVTSKTVLSAHGKMALGGYQFNPCQQHDPVDDVGELPRGDAAIHPHPEPDADVAFDRLLGAELHLDERGDEQGAEDERPDGQLIAPSLCCRPDEPVDDQADGVIARMVEVVNIVGIKADFACEDF